MKMKLNAILGMLAISAFTPLPANATNVLEWSHCGSGNQCTTDNKGQPIVMRLMGENDRSIYWFASALPKANNEYNVYNQYYCGEQFGDPNFGKNKTCSYTHASAVGLRNVNDYKQTVNNGQSFNLTPKDEKDIKDGVYHWMAGKVTYVPNPLSSKSYTYMSYALVSGYKPKCDPSVLTGVTGGNGDGIPAIATLVDQKCHILEEMPPQLTATPLDQVQSCANSGAECKINNSQIYVTDVKNPTGLQITRLLSSGTGGFNCNGEWIRPNQGHNDFFCRTLPLMPSKMKTTASWKPIEPCGGESCSEGYKVQKGSTYSQSSSDTTTWSASIGASVESGVGITLPDGSLSEKVTLSMSIGFAESQSFKDALAESTTVEVDAQCGNSESTENFTLYQFQVNSEGICKLNESCDATVQPAGALWCVGSTNKPENYQGPLCFPGYCDPSDPFCQTCKGDKKQANNTSISDKG